MTANSETAGTTLEDALTEIASLENTNAQLLTDLEECRDQLFALVQKSNDIPEQTIKDAFIRIIEGIESWIDDISGDESFPIDFRLQYQRNLQSGSRDTLFRKLFKQHCSDITWQTNLSQVTNCHYAILSLLISRWLVGNIFLASDEVQDWNLYPVGLSPNQISFVRQVERAMASQSADASRYPKWRSETVSVLATTRRFQNNVEDHTRRCCQELKADLSNWIGSRLISEHFLALRQRVIDPAIKLIDITARSHKTYVLSFDAVTPGSFPSGSIEWNFKDIASWRNAGANDLLGCTTSLYPGIIRKGSESQPDLLLIKPVALGYRDPALQPRASRSNSPYPPRPEPGRLEREPSDLAKHGMSRRSDRETASDASRQSRPSRKQSPPKLSRPPPDTRAPTPKQRPSIKARLGTSLAEFIGLTPDAGSPAPQPSPPDTQRSRRGSTKTTQHQQRHEHGVTSPVDNQSQDPRHHDYTDEPAYHSRPLTLEEHHYEGVPAGARANVDTSEHPQVEGHITYRYAQLEPWRRNASPS